MQSTLYDNFEIVVVDNGSTDESVAWLHKQVNVSVLAQDTNLGFCGGNNVGISQTSGEFVVLLNNDVEVEPSWLAELVQPAVADSTVAAAQPKILDYFRRDHFEYAGGAGGHLDEVGYPFARGRLFDCIEKDDGQYDNEAAIFWASGAALLLRRSAIEQVGVLDDRLFMHMEEIDLCWRLWQANYRVVLSPTSKVYHMGGASLSQSDPRKVYYNFRNSLLLLYKHSAPRQWPTKFAKRFLLDILATVRGVLVMRPKESVAIVRAYVDAHKLRRSFDRDRPTNRSDVFPPSFAGSIASQYFFRRRKFFTSLPSGQFREPFR